MRALYSFSVALALLALPASALAQGANTSEPSSGPPLPADEKPDPSLLDKKQPTTSNPPGSSSQAADGQSPDGSPPGVRLVPDSLMDTTMSRSWNEGRTRAFLATTLDVGWTYLRPRASVGYGKPFGTWFGFDANPIISGTGIGGYAGIRLALPRIDIRVGPRYFFSFNRFFLAEQGSYNRQDLDADSGKKSTVLTFETEIEGSLPAGPGDIIGLGSFSYLIGVPDGYLVFEETLRTIVKPPIVWRARLGYVFRFGSFRQHSIGLVGDALDVPNRDDSKTFRLGPIVRIVLSRRVEVRGSFVPTIYSPDHLGLIGGDFTELGFRYRWATE